ncbi:MAG: hydroxymethylbilane synthase [Flavisolibacter sp.]
MSRALRIGTRDSELAVWQATLVSGLLKKSGYDSELVYIKSEGDVDTITPLYELGVQGVFTKTLDAALLNNRIDLAVHSMKDVPTQMAQGLQQAAVLQRGSVKDILVYKKDSDLERIGYRDGQWTEDSSEKFIVATGSVRRIAQWMHRYPTHQIENLRGNVNTRLRKLSENYWNGAVFAAAGLERINLRPKNSVDLNWMLPAPAQGAIMVACREDDDLSFQCCQHFHDEATALCTQIERDFLRALLGGCSTPISALAEIKEGSVFFQGNIVRPDGKEKAEVQKQTPLADAANLGLTAAKEILLKGGQTIVEGIRKKGLASNGKI